jgi:hypothetical protein
MFVILIQYRARGAQAFRRDEIIGALKNFSDYFKTHNVPYKIVICEQNNDDKFNRGVLLNAAFIESEKMENSETHKYMHMNGDYRINEGMAFPLDILNFSEGFLDIHLPPYDVLGACCVFDGKSYTKTNGFPNNLYGWGGDDWAIYRRIKERAVKYYRTALTNSGWIQEDTGFHKNTDISMNQTNIQKGLTEPIDSSGLNNCKYENCGVGDFHNNDTIFHYLIDFSF